MVSPDGQHGDELLDPASPGLDPLQLGEPPGTHSSFVDQALGDVDVPAGPRTPCPSRGDALYEGGLVTARPLQL
jgi:hypothetical protein